MATYLDLVTRLLVYTEKIPYSETSTAQRDLALQDVNDAVRYVYNNGDLSFKTVVLRQFAYTPPTIASGVPSKGVALPANFMGFHQTGGVYRYLNPTAGSLIYVPYHKMMRWLEGELSLARGIPTHYSLGGASAGDSAANQRELLLWPFPTEATTLLNLVYQRTAPDDIAAIAGATVQIPRIPAAWHLPVVLAMAKMFRKMDKGADESALAKTLATAIKQMNIQEPHGREKPRHRVIHPAWR